MPNFELTFRQQEANKLLASAATHCMLFGGARSGKTFLLCRAIAIRALKAEGSRHAILRYRFNHVKASVWHDTWPKMMRLCYPEVPYGTDKSDWFVELPNRSQVWFGGLDDKERTEKILGQEYCLDPKSKVLTADLRWIEAGALEVSDELIGFPEALDGHCKLIPTVVERTSIIRAERYRVVTDKGSTVVSARHRFVAHYDDRRHKNYRQFSWRMAEELRVGDRVRWTCSPWEEGTTKEDGWFAGMLDGEGWVSRPARQVGVAQCEGPVLDAMRDWLSKNAIKYTEHVSNGFASRKGPCHQLKAGGLWASLRLLGIARPKRLDPRVIWETCRAFRNLGHDAEILSIEKLGVGDVVALGTSTKTLIADGFLGHNSTIFLNECSQISFSARETVRTRLAQKTELKLKAYYDENPPLRTHWTHRVFIEKRNAEPPYGALDDPNNYAAMLLNPAHNAENLPESYLKELQSLTPRARARFWEGKFGDAAENALWSYETISRHRATKHPDLQRIVVAVDPSGTKGDEDSRSDEVGVVVAGLGVDGEGYVLEDMTLNAPPAVWGKVVATTFERHAADVVVGEANYGGAMVEHVVQSAASQQNITVPYKEVTATRGKVVRAEPIAALYEQGRVHHVGVFPELEDQLTSFTTAGYMGDRSPDRADAAIWALSELFPGMVQRKTETVSRRKPRARASAWVS